MLLYYLFQDSLHPLWCGTCLKKLCLPRIPAFHTTCLDHVRVDRYDIAFPITMYCPYQPLFSLNLSGPCFFGFVFLSSDENIEIVELILQALIELCAGNSENQAVVINRQISHDLSWILTLPGAAHSVKVLD